MVTTVDDRLRRIWLLFGLVLFLHGVVDPAVTYLIVRVIGIGIEANPILRGSLESGPVVLVTTLLPLLLLVVGCLGAITVLFRRADETEQEQIFKLSIVVLTMSILWGIGLLVWNLWVLVRGLYLTGSIVV